MDPRVRAVRTAQKRPAAYEVVASEGSESDGDGEVSEALSVSDIPDSTSSTSEGGGSLRILALPPNTGEFASWEAFDEFMAAYQAQTLQVFRARTNTTVAERNARIDKTQSNAEKIPALWVQYSRTFVCTHWGKYKSQTTGKRPRQETRRKGCKAQINACVQVVDPKKRTLAVRITRCQMEHNHHLDSVSYKSHPANRLNLNETTLRTVDTLQKTGVKKTGIIRHILENTDSNPTPKDVQNLVLKLKARAQRDGPSSSDKRLKKWMKEFGAQSGNVGRIFLDDVGNKRVATCITLQTKHMRDMFEQFPEVLLIDATHGTNRSNYKVFSFMAHDTFGKGQFVQHALLHNERYETLLTAIEEFKTNNPAWSRLQCVLVDKDFTELSVLKAAFPGVTVLLCQFHVLKYLREEIASSDYGFSKAQKEQLGGVISLLVYAKTEAEYDKHFAYMVHLAFIGYSVAPSADTVTDTAGDGSGA
ncbi:hypothetical protein PHPALM_29374, partial [Phytophthora palmivora]